MINISTLLPIVFSACPEEEEEEATEIIKCVVVSSIIEIETNNNETDKVRFEMYEIARKSMYNESSDLVDLMENDDVIKIEWLKSGEADESLIVSLDCAQCCRHHIIYYTLSLLTGISLCILERGNISA